MIPHCTWKVIGGELQERLIPVPYSKTSTDQAVSTTPVVPLARPLAVSLTCLPLHPLLYFCLALCSRYTDFFRRPTVLTRMLCTVLVLACTLRDTIS
ncbi:hypothetical protein EVAR_46853_1 [Eumeta japonica]|uniref:Uncharacterized protein n=1 Tax=Eumeta variegata TaxID=151549 RepID=A0A4C1XS92_EUMVA|nr:hypothetical protein EVAR_46853_1 [Eumeta japonica]